jgi:hypothetical protein
LTHLGFSAISQGMYQPEDQSAQNYSQVRNYLAVYRIIEGVIRTVCHLCSAPASVFLLTSCWV